MTYRVAWTELADEELAAVWLQSSDRNAVTKMANLLEWLLTNFPFNVGESRESTLSRIVYSSPLGMYFEIIPDDLKVLIHSVWLIR